MEKTWGYSANNRINDTGFFFDAAGNMTQQPGPITFQWDAENRLKSVDNTGATYVYDASGLRVKRATGSGTVEYAYLGGQMMAELSGVWSDYIFAGGRMIARSPATASMTGTVYYHTDHLGSTRLLTDSTGATVSGSSYDYKPFGEATPSPSSLASSPLFTSLPRDAASGEAGLDHTWFRKYDSLCGRWLSPDPLGGSVGNPQSLNRYAYVLNNPVNLIDPFGLLCTLVGITDWYGVWTVDGIRENPRNWDYLYTVYTYDCSWNGGSFGGQREARDPADRPFKPRNLDAADACAEMANFAAILAKAFPDATKFANAFGEWFAGVGDQPGTNSYTHMHDRLGNQNLTPVQFGVGQPGHPGAFAHQYRDSLNPRQDQTHHFAAYFQTAVRLGWTAATGAAFATDLGNSGDLALGLAAADIGARLRSGKIGTSGVADLIRRLCIGKPK